MIKIFILLLLSITSSLAYTPDASTYITDFPIFVNGDVKSIENSFKFVNKLFSDMNLIENIVLLASLLLTIATALRYVKTMTMHPVAINTAYLTFGVMSFLGTLNVNVHIEDQRTQINYTKYGGINYAKVEDIPFPIAAVVSISSTFTYTLLEKVNDATVTVDTEQAGYSAIGFAKSFTDTQKMIKFARLSSDDDSRDFENAFVEYVQTCLLDKAYYNGHTNIMSNIRNPKGDFLKFNEPTKYNVGSESTVFTDSNYVSYPTCQAVYGFLTSKYQTVANKVKDDLQNVITGDANFLALSEISNMKIDDTILSGTLAPLQTFQLNAALIKPLSRAIRNSSATTLSGQDLANDITFESSKAKMQMEGIGQYKWMAEMLPLGFHFFMSIIYASSAFVFIIALAMGYEKGIALISNFAQGLLTFEFIQVAMALANNTVNSYAKEHAADQLAGLGDNLASLDNINYYLDYLATMTGIAGILGVSAVFIIPTIVFTGKVAVAAGAIGGLAGKYSGNDVQTSRDTSSESIAKREAFDNMQKEAHALRLAGYDVPSDMSQGDFYNKLQSDLNATSKGLMSASLGSSALSNASVASGYENLSNVTSSMQVASNTSVADNISHGTLTGAKSASDIEMSGAFVTNEGQNGIDSYIKGSQAQSLRDKYATSSMGNSLTLDDAKNLGTSSSSMQAEQDKAMYNSREKMNLLGTDAYATDLAKSSMSNRFDKESAEFAGVGRANISNTDLSAVNDMSKGKFEEGLISAGVYSSKAMTNGELRSDYIDAVKGSEASKIGSMIATTKGMGGSDNQEAFATASSYVKAKEDVGTFQGKLQEAGMSKDDAENFGKNAGEAFTRTLDSAATKLASLAETKSGTQVRSDIKSIDAAGGDEGYRSMMSRQAAGNVLALGATMSEADKTIGYENSLTMGAREKTGTGIASLIGKLAGGQIDLSGSLTSEGFQSTYQSAVTSAAEGIQRSSDFNNQEKMNDVAANASKRAYEITKQTTGDTKKAEAKAKEVLSELSTMMNDVKFDDKGNITDGEFVAKTGDMMAKTIGEGAGRRYTEKMQGSTFGGLTFDMKDGQISASMNQGTNAQFANIAEDGTKTTANVGDAGTLPAAFTKEAVALGLNPKALFSAVGGNMHASTSEWLQKEFGLSKEEAETTASTMGYATAAAGAVATAEGLHRFANYALGNRVAKEDFSYQTGTKLNADGVEEPVYKNVKAGQEINVNKDPYLKEFFEGNKDLFKTEGGMPSKFMSKTSGMFDKIGFNLENSLDPSSVSSESPSEATNKTINSSTEPQNNHSNSEVKQESKHDSSFSNKDNTIISQNGNELNTGNSKSKDILKNAVQNQISELDKNISNMSNDEYISKYNELSDIEDRLDKGKAVHTKALSNAGISTKDLGLSLNDKGFVDIESSDAKFEKASKAYESALEKQTAKDTTSLDTPESSKPQPISLGSQTAQDRWLDEQMKHFDSDTEKGSAAIKTLEGFKGQDLGALDDFWKKKIGLDSNAMHRIGQIDDGMIPNLNNLPEDMKANTPHNVLNDTPSKVAGNRFMQGAIALGALFGIDSIASELTGSDSIISDFKNGNIGTGSIRTAEALDPTIAGVKTVREQTTSAYQNYNNGNYLSATGDIASIPQKFAANVLESGYEFGQFIGGATDSAINYFSRNDSIMDNFVTTTSTQQAFQQEMANGLPQQLQAQMQNMSVNNSMNLASNANTMHLDSIGGQVNIGQNSTGMLRVNGMQTQLPYANFQGAMQNDIMRNNFANMVSGIDMNNGNPFEGQSIHSVDGLMDQMQQRFNTQEYYAMGQRKDVNMIGSYAEESFEKMEELMQSNDTFIETIEDLQKTINNY